MIEAMIERCAGIDVGKKFVLVCVMIGGAKDEPRTQKYTGYWLAATKMSRHQSGVRKPSAGQIIIRGQTTNITATLFACAQENSHCLTNAGQGKPSHPQCGRPARLCRIIMRENLTPRWGATSKLLSFLPVKIMTLVVGNPPSQALENFMEQGLSH